MSFCVEADYSTCVLFGVDWGELEVSNSLSIATENTEIAEKNLCRFGRQIMRQGSRHNLLGKSNCRLPCRSTTASRTRFCARLRIATASLSHHKTRLSCELVVEDERSKEWMLYKRIHSLALVSSRLYIVIFPTFVRSQLHCEWDTRFAR